MGIENRRFVPELEVDHLQCNLLSVVRLGDQQKASTNNGYSGLMRSRL